MLISESTYRLIYRTESGARWLNRAVIRPYYFLLRVLLG